MNPLEKLVNSFERPTETPEVTPQVETPSSEVPNNVETPTGATEQQVAAEHTDDGIVELDVPETEVTSTTQPEAFDFESFVKDTGIEAKSRDEFKTKVKELTSKEDPLKGVPENLRKAVEFAKNGGDALQYLKISQVDYSQIDPAVLFENQILSTVGDKAKAQEYLDSLSPLAKEIEGEKLKQQYIQLQAQQEAQLRAELDANTKKELQRKAENEERLRSTLNKVEDVAGFKVKPSQKDKFLKDVTEGNLTKKLFFNEKGEYDYDKMFRIAFLAENFDSIQKYYKGKVKNETTRQIINEISNPTIERPTGNLQADSEPKSNFEHWANSKKK
jgi:hypothetical protein